METGTAAGVAGTRDIEGSALAADGTADGTADSTAVEGLILAAPMPTAEEFPTKALR